MQVHLCTSADRSKHVGMPSFLTLCPEIKNGQDEENHFPQMGHATAEAVVRAGLQLVPVSFTGASEAVAVGNVGVSGVPVELVAPEERQSAMDKVKEQYPGLVLIDFTLPSVVNGAQCTMLMFLS